MVHCDDTSLRRPVTRRGTVGVGALIVGFCKFVSHVTMSEMILGQATFIIRTVSRQETYKAQGKLAVEFDST